MTAIEWLQEKYKQQGTIFKSQFEQAKEMENQQMKEMYLKDIENYDPTFKNK